MYFLRAINEIATDLKGDSTGVSLTIKLPMLTCPK